MSGYRMWSVENPFMKREGTKSPTVLHGPIGITYHPKGKPNAIADCLENQFTSHDLGDENHGLRVENRA
jgi:hypothetical protein